MASVARAIEQAASKSVNANLWWEPQASLFYALDKCGLGTVGGDSGNPSEGDARLVEELKAHHGWLLNTLEFFKAPNEASKNALSSSRVDVGSHSLDIKPDLRELALQVSTHLVLDEVQSYILLSRHIEPGALVPFSADRAFLQAITMYYYVERQCLLKCSRLLLTFQMAEEGEALSSYKVMSLEVKQLLEDGLEDKTLSNLKDRLAVVQPQHLDREYTVFWAEETVLEQSLLLDILFLLYYEPLNSCKASRFKELLTCFQTTVFGSGHGERLAFSPEAARCVVHVRQQAVLILIEAFDLENLLLMVHEETPFSQGGHAFSVAEVQELDSTIGNLNTSETAEYAPLLLGWATFLCLVSFLPADVGQAPYQEMDLSAYVRQAYDGGAYSYLLDMLRSESFQESDVQVGGYKSVVKTLAAAFLAAYDSATRMNYEGYDILINIFCEIYRGQESLCLELWDRDSVIDGPIRNLLFTLREDFPYQTLSLVRLLAAQCKGSWPAECVYDFLYKTVKITSLYQHPEGIVVHENGSVVQTNVALQVPDAPGLMIPRGTFGRISRIIDGRVSLVHWECEHSGIVILLLRMLQRSSSGYQFEEVHASLDLLQQMLASNKGLAQLLLDLDGAVATVTARRDGRMEDCLRIDVVAMICAIVNGLTQSGGNDVMLSTCLHILGSFALCSPCHVIEELDRTSLLQPFGSSTGGVGVFAGSLLQMLLQNVEQSTGEYPLVLAALDFTKIMIQKGIEAEVLSSLVTFMVRDLLVNHGNWKYQQPHHRWQIATQALQVSLTILTGAASRMSSGNLRRVVLETFLFDSIIQDFIFQILSIGPTLEELHYSRAVRPRELEWVQHALHTVLLLIHHVLLDVTVGLAAKDYPGMSLLEQSLLRKFAGPLPVVAVIASFLSFSRNVDMQIASAKALTSLCVSAQKARPHSVSIASYISSPDQRKALLSVVCQCLAEEGWVSQQDLFIATVELLTTAVKWQPSLVALLLFPAEQSHVTSGLNHGAPSTHSGVPGSSGVDGTNGVLDVLWKTLLKSAELVKSHPQMLSRVLFLLTSIWEGGIEYLRIIEALRQRPNFWGTLASGLSFATGLTANPIPTLHMSTSDLSKHEILLQAFRYRCEASILSIMACDIFLQQYLLYPSSNDSSSTDRSQSSNYPSSEQNLTLGNTASAAVKLPSSSKSGAFKIVSEWAKKSATSSILKSYAICSYDQEVILRAKAEARLLIVGMIGKILAGDIRGMSAVLLERLQQTMTQVFQLASFEVLVAQYASRGYSHGKQLQVMLMSDLYHHLQGEIVGGRPLPSGPFQQIAAFLLTKEAELVGSIGKAPILDGIHPAYGNGYLYNVKALEEELGLEWWPQTESAILPSSVVERSLRFLQRANAMASLGHSQLSALRAWAAVATVSIFDKHGARGELGASEFEWNNEDVNRYIEDLCKALESAVMAIGVAGDTSNLLPTFMTMQAHLLLIFVRFLWIRGSPSSSGRVQLWAVCTMIVRTTVSCLKLQLDSHVAFRQHGEELVKELLGAFLIALEIIYAHIGGTVENGDERTKEGQEMGDGFADVTLTGIGFLPGLCTAVEHPSYVNLALAGINLLIKGFIAPTTWVSILQNHLPTRSLIGRMHADLGTESPRVALNICLSLARTRVGAEMLQNTGIFSHLLTLSKQLQEDNKVMSGSLEGPFSVWPNQDQPPEGQLWSLQLTVVTALIHSGGDKVLGGSLVESAFTYIASLKELLLLSLRAPVPGLDIQGRKKAKLQQPRTTITALQEVQHVMSLLCELSSHQMTWRRTLPDSIAEFEEMGLHLLAYIAREGLVRSGVYHSSHIGIRCQPVLKEEIAAHARPSIVGSSAGWFVVCARGCSVKERNGSASPPKNAIAATTSSLLRTGSSSPSSGLVISGSSIASTSSAACTEYSDLVAINVYRLVLLLLKFTCKQVQYAVDRFENGGTADYGHFPQLPAPEVLYPLQDQVGAILIEVLRARDGKAVQGVVKDVCLLLLSILEKSLYLGVSVSRSCGLNPHPVRVDDFGKEYRALLSVEPGTPVSPVSRFLSAGGRVNIPATVAPKAHPQMLSRVLFLLTSIWEGGIEYLRIIEALRQRPNFWGTLASGLSFATGLTANPIPTLHMSTSDLSKHEILLQAFRYRCEASILSIMACDIFLQQYLLYPSSNDSSSTDRSQSSNYPSSEQNLTLGNTASAAVKLPSSSKSGAFKIVSEWAKKSATSSILKSYAICSYDQEVILRAKAEARLLIVGMIGKILAGDIRGMSAVLLERLQQTMTQVFQLASFEVLVAQYASRGYSHGKQLQVMLMSDLYHHLQGEIVGGRPLPSGPFQQIAAFLLTKEAELVGSIGKAPILDGIHPAYGNGYLYNVKALEEELGLEWWPQTESAILPSSVVERSLRFLQRANAMASLGHSQLSALRAWAAVATVSIFDKHGARGELGASEFEWNNEDVNRYIEDLCKALESAVMAIGVAGDTSNLLPTFMTMQAHLLLIFVRFLWIRGSPSSSGRVQLWAVCTMIVRTTVSCLKLQLDSHVAFRQHGEELVKELLGAFLIALEIIYAHIGGTVENGDERTKEGQEMGDGFADVTLTGIGFLPGLCTAVEHPSYVNLALAGINLLIKGFIAPTTWVSILQNHLPTRSLIGRMHADLGTESPRVALNICLSLARTRVGAEMLQNTGIFSHLLTLSKQLQEDNKVMSGSLEGPFSVWPNQDQPPEGQLWSLQLTVVTALIHSGGDKVLGGSLVESAFTYIASLKELLLLSLRAPVPGLDIQGRKKAKLQQPRTTITALQEVQHVMSLLCELSSHQMTWRRTLPDSIAEFEEMGLHLLAYIAREGLVRSGVYHSSHIGIRCQPVLKEEIAAHARPSIVGSSAGWFVVCARGCSVKERNGSASPPKNAIAATTSSLLRTGSSSPSSGLVISGSSIASTSSAACTEYSDLVAINVYRLVLLLLKFTCKQVQYAVDRFENGGTADYGHFPQLPAPEVLYPLQDQVGAILIEVLRARDGKAVQGVVKDVCLLLLSILEKSLYLGVSVSRSCGLNPHPVRVDDFGKEYRALLSASQSHQFLESPLRSLKRVVALAYPEIS